MQLQVKMVIYKVKLVVRGRRIESKFVSPIIVSNQIFGDMKRIFLFAMMLGLAAACSGKAAEPQRPVVYMTTEISPDALVRIYEALDRPAEGRVAVKISTGEPGGHNFLQPSLIRSTEPLSSAIPRMKAGALPPRSTSRPPASTASSTSPMWTSWIPRASSGYP